MMLCFYLLRFGGIKIVKNGFDESYLCHFMTAFGKNQLGIQPDNGVGKIFHCLMALSFKSLMEVISGTITLQR
jgi:hypothetical protein